MYKIRKSLMGAFERKVATLNKRAEKLGVQPMEFKIVDTILEDNLLYDVVEVSQKQEVKINGWKFCAELERNVNDTFIIKGDSENIPTEVKELRTCQHCNTNRKRNWYYILQNEETLQYIMVGGSCLIDFVGHANAEKVANYYATFYNTLIDYSDIVKEGILAQCNHSIDYGYDLYQVLKCAIHSIKDRGYHNTQTDYSTKDEVQLMLDGNRYHRQMKEDADAIPNEQVDEIINHILNKEDDSDFINNLKSIIKDKYVKTNLLGYVVCMPTVYFRDMQQQKEKEEIANASNYVGEVGVRQTIKATYERTLIFEGYYGPTYMEFFKTEEGDVIIWRTTTPKQFEENAMYDITATVKEHSEFNNVKQTFINRPKFAMC